MADWPTQLNMEFMTYPFVVGGAEGGRARLEVDNVPMPLVEVADAADTVVAVCG